MKDFEFMEQMEENIKTCLIFPYHVYHEKLRKPEAYNINYPNNYHMHSFEEVVRIAYLESKAFYLTDEDKVYYSAQEINFINKVIATENEKINNGYELVDLELNEETIEMINLYKLEHNMTFEEAVIDILSKIVENPEVLKNE